MTENQISLHQARQIIKETIQELEGQLKTYYVANSSYFDTHRYDYRTISQTVKKNGGENLRIEPVFGMGNQPNVVVFDAHEDMVEDMVARLAERLGTEWVHIREKDW